MIQDQRLVVIGNESGERLTLFTIRKPRMDIDKGWDRKRIGNG